MGWSPAPTLALLVALGTRQDDGVLPLTTVRVVGPSMEPAVRNGEWWIVRRTEVLKPGHVVMMRHPERQHLTVVKRLDHLAPEGWYVRGDNPDMSEDSRQFGLVPLHLIEGRLLFRYRPLPPVRV